MCVYVLWMCVCVCAREKDTQEGELTSTCKWCLSSLDFSCGCHPLPLCSSWSGTRKANSKAAVWQQRKVRKVCMSAHTCAPTHAHARTQVWLVFYVRELFFLLGMWDFRTDNLWDVEVWKMDEHHSRLPQQTPLQCPWGSHLNPSLLQRSCSVANNIKLWLHSVSVCMNLKHKAEKKEDGQIYI